MGIAKNRGRADAAATTAARNKVTKTWESEEHNSN